MDDFSLPLFDIATSRQREEGPQKMQRKKLLIEILFFIILHFRIRFASDIPFQHTASLIQKPETRSVSLPPSLFLFQFPLFSFLRNAFKGRTV